MSRSKPTGNTPNPAVRWFEWNGEHGTVRYYDKDAKQNVDVPLPFTFLLLDELGSVRGWDDTSGSGIYSNEVRDTRTDILVVKAFKGGTLAEGLYRDIKDKMHTRGGKFVAGCYIAFKQGADLAIGSLRLSGAALGSWMEFRKLHRGDIYNAAVNITGFTEGKKGRIVFRMPTFSVKDVSADTQNIAIALDAQLQTWLDEYLGRTTQERAESAPAEADASWERGDGVDEVGNVITADDIPF
jgi:hypothetical protein